MPGGMDGMEGIYGGLGHGGMAGGYDRQRDEERERERVRNGVRGMRTGQYGFGGPMGGVVHSPEVRRLQATINPTAFDCAPKFAKFYVIKSYSEDDVHKSIKYGVWASTDTGNRRLDAAYRDHSHAGPIVRDLPRTSIEPAAPLGPPFEPA